MHNQIKRGEAHRKETKFVREAEHKPLNEAVVQDHPNIPHDQDHDPIDVQKVPLSPKEIRGLPALEIEARSNLIHSVNPTDS